MTDSEYLTNELSRSTQNILDVSVSRVLGFSKTVQNVVPEQKTNEPKRCQDIQQQYVQNMVVRKLLPPKSTAHGVEP